MATVINSITGKVLYGTFSNKIDLLNDETIIDLNITENFISPFYNFETESFYENATQEEVNQHNNALRGEKIKAAYEQRKTDGWEAYQNFRADMVKEIYDGIITKEQAIIIKNYLSLGYDEISQFGDYETAIYKLMQILLPEEHLFVHPYLLKAKSIMLNYIRNNYKPM